MIYLAQHRENPRLTESIEASVGTPENWRATCKEIIDGKDPDQAQDEAANEVRRIHEKILEEEHRTPIDRRTKWESQRFRRWVRHQPCIFTGTQDHQRVDPAHIRSKGSGFDDFRNVVPVRNDLHRLSHDQGWWHILQQHSKDLAWLYEKADIALVGWLNEVCSEGLERPAPDGLTRQLRVTVREDDSQVKRPREILEL